MQPKELKGIIVGDGIVDVDEILLNHTINDQRVVAQR
jgi:hypothetical protein